MRAFAESVERYDAEPRETGTIAAAMMIRHGELIVWTNPHWIITEYDRAVLDAWVRLQIVRGRRAGVFPANALHVSRHPNRPTLADAPPT